MADSVVRLTVNSSEYDQKLKRAAEGLTRYADECRKVGGTLEVVEKDTLEYVRALGQMDTVSRTATGKLAEMKKTFTELSVVYKNMTDEEKNSPFGKALATSLDQLKGRIGESKMQLDDINKSINGGDGLSGALDAVAGKFGLSVDQVTKFGGVVGVATTAVQVAKDAFFQSESNIDEWGRTVEGAKGAYSVFLDTLNNGNWSNFFQNLSAAIQGGRDLYDVFDRLGSIKSNNAAAIAITQKEIAELRLAKQQGENVDAKLKSATERLAALQKQSVSAGMTAGSQSAFQTIRNGVNSVGGAGINDATIKYAVDRIMKGGQGEFDKYKRNYEILQQKGMVTRTQTINDSQGGTYERQYKVFDINALTTEQQKQYALAKSITEGETRIQKGIAAYAQAVSEGTASAREEFKGNRYALQGAGSGGGRSGGGGGLTDKVVEDSIDEILAKQWETASRKMATMADSLRGEDTGPSDVWKSITTNADKATDSITSLAKAFGELNKAEGLPENGTGQPDDVGKNTKTMAKEMEKYVDISNGMLGGINNIVGGLQGLGIEIPKELQGVIGGIQGLMSIVTGIAAILSIIQTLQAIQTTESTIKSIPVVGWLLAQGGVVHAASGYEVPGNNYSGDQVPALLNSGELVLNKAQQGNLASQLQGNGLQNMNIAGRIKGTDIILSIDRSLKLEGKQLLTWGR